MWIKQHNLTQYYHNCADGLWTPVGRRHFCDFATANFVRISPVGMYGSSTGRAPIHVNRITPAPVLENLWFLKKKTLSVSVLSSTHQTLYNTGFLI